MVADLMKSAFDGSDLVSGFTQARLNLSNFETVSLEGLTGAVFEANTPFGKAVIAERRDGR